jgi:hypothetical protein
MSNTSFLPEDYLEQKAERRTNFISLTLFAIVMVSVFAAFLVTNRKWSQVRTAQREINSKYQEFASQIETYDELQKQKDEMMSRAKLAAALVEKVPRGILLWELIVRMPQRLGLVEFDLKSEKAKVQAQAGPRRETRGARRLAGGPRRPRTVTQVKEDEPKKVDVPHFVVKVKLVGVAPSDSEVSTYLKELDGFELVQDVRLEYTEKKQVDGREMRQFAMTMTVNPDFDARYLAPMARAGNLGDAMSDRLKFDGTRKGGS